MFFSIISPTAVVYQRNEFLLKLPVPEASSIYGFTVPIAEELESSIFKNLGRSHTTRTAIIASIKKISMAVSFLRFPISSSSISFFQLTQPPIRNGIEALIFGITTGISIYFI